MSTTIKRALSLFLCAALLFGALPLAAVHAADPTSGTCGTNLTWVYDSGAKTLTISGTGEMNNYDDEYYNGTYVTSAPWQPYDNTMQTLVINSGVTSIGYYAFYKCTGLTSVTIPDSVTIIGNDTFCGCTGLTSVTIPESVTYIGCSAFRGTGLTSVTIPNSVVTIDYSAFRSTGLTSVTIPNSVEVIGECAFDSCSNLSRITIGKNVIRIDSEAFYGCTSLNDVYFCGTQDQWNAISISSLSNDALLDAIIHFLGFEYMGWICMEKTDHSICVLSPALSNEGTERVIPSEIDGKAVTIVDDYAITNYYLLTSLTIPKTVTRIGKNILCHHDYYHRYAEELIHEEPFFEHYAEAKAYFQMECEAAGGVESAYYFGTVTFFELLYYCDHGVWPPTPLTDIYYEGTEEEWNRIEIGSDNEALLNANIHFLGMPPHTHSYTSTVTKQPTCSEAGERTYTCECGNSYTEPVAKLPHTWSEWHTVVYPTAATGGSSERHCERCSATESKTLPKALSNCEVEENRITGIEAGLTANRFLALFVSNQSVSVTVNSQALGTGAKVTIAYDDVVINYEIVLFGDVDGDGWYDGTDAYFVSLVANGLIAPTALTDAQRAAADANHDGSVDAADVALIEKAGLLLNDIDQTAAPDELETSSVYFEYCSLIDQNIEIIEPAADEEPQPAAQSLWSRVMAFFNIILNWLLRMF